MIRLLTIVIAVTLWACDRAPAPEWRFGFNITGLEFVLYDDTEGIHPSQVVLDNPKNPFRNLTIGETTKFDILSEGGNAGGFYAWATLLARVPTGEHQYYTATKLGDICAANEISDPAQLETVRMMAIAAFQSVLDNFPDSVSYDATGTIPFRLATPAYKAIVSLGGRPDGNWVLVTTPDGEQAVQGGSDVVPLPDAEEEEES